MRNFQRALKLTLRYRYTLAGVVFCSMMIAAFWGGKYRQKLDVARAIKCVTAPTFLHPVRIARSPATGELVPHPEQPEEYDLIPKAS